MKKKKKNTIVKTMALIEKKYGKGSIMRLGDKPLDPGICVSTGSVSLDKALGGKGLPFGRIIELYGPESAGKTSLALKILANTQKTFGPAGIVDAEHALDPAYAKKIGVNIEDLYLSQPSYGEQALGIVRELIKGGKLKTIVIDSVAALVPKKELEGEMDDETVALQARMMGKALRKIAALADIKKVLVIFLNQERDKIGWGFSRGGKTTPGGRALKFWASVRIEIRRVKTEKEGQKETSNFVFAKVVKSKICPPFRVGRFYITFDKGIDKAKELFLWAREGKILRKKKGKFVFEDITERSQKKFLEVLLSKKNTRKRFLKITSDYIQSRF